MLDDLHHTDKELQHCVHCILSRSTCGHVRKDVFHSNVCNPVKNKTHPMIYQLAETPLAAIT